MLTMCRRPQWPAHPAQDMFIFRVEGTGVLRPDEVVSMALEWMQQKMLTLNTALKSNTGDDAMLE